MADGGEFTMPLRRDHLGIGCRIEAGWKTSCVTILLIAHNCKRYRCDLHAAIRKNNNSNQRSLANL